MIPIYSMGFALPVTSQDDTGSPTTTTEWIYLNDNVQYSNPAFGPAITMPQRSLLSLRGPYLPVQQSLQLDVLGDTPNRCWENFNKLLQVLHQSDRWYESVPGNTIVRMFVQATPSAPVVYADVLGFIGDSAPDVATEIPTPLGPRYALQGVTITFLRFGVWERATRQILYADPSTNPRYPAPKAAQITFPALGGAASDVYSRIAIRGRGNYSWQNNAYMAIVQKPEKIHVIDSANLPAGGTETSDALTTNAYGGTFRRYTMSGPVNLDVTIAPTFHPARRVAVFAKIRNNSASRALTVTLDTLDAIRNPAAQIWNTAIPANSTGDALGEPRIVFLGTIDRDYELNRVGADSLPRITFTPSTTGSDTFDIDYITLVALDDPWADTILFLAANNRQSTTIDGDSNAIVNAGVDGIFGLLDVQKRSYPLVIQSLGNDDLPDSETIPTYQGNAHIVCRGNSFVYSFMAEFRGLKATSGGVSATVWQPDPDSAWWLLAYQSPAYLVPPGE